jgi:hypothetical protein
MSLDEYIAANRGELDRIIRAAVGDPNFDLDDAERRDWVENDEGLYLSAKADGVVFDDEDDEG